MKATVKKISENRIDVLVRGRMYGLDTYRHPELFSRLSVGQIIETKRVPNNPFLVVVKIGPNSL